MQLDSHPYPWWTVQALPPDCGRELRRRAIFECCKWDPQVEDVDTLAPFAVVLKRSAWQSLSSLAEALAAETLALEQALICRPDLHRQLAIPKPIRRAMEQDPHTTVRPRDLRVMRFDFHPTEQGWQVSEANTDVPGGYNEASGWTGLVAEHVTGGIPAGDPARALLAGVRDRVPLGGTVALVHATAYADDRQVMTYLSRQFQRNGFQAVLLAPDHLDWRDGEAVINTCWLSGRADFVFRFFPAEWLPNLGRKTAWQCFFGTARTPLCNPATALLTQSKRWPLLCDRLGIDLPFWNELLPKTCDPREADWRRNSDWVLKPALGRVGDLVGIAGATDARQWKTIRRGVRWWPRHWVAQRRFTPLPIVVDGQCWHICFGVFTIDGRAAGVYGRVASRALINNTAREVAVLVEHTPLESPTARRQEFYEPLGTL